MARPSWELVWAVMLLLTPFTASHADVSQIIQIHTRFTKVWDTASWLVIVHDLDSSGVYPYVFDLVDADNFFLIYTNARNYRLDSVLQFDLSQQKFHHFCLPTQNITGKSLIVYLRGNLTADPATLDCNITQFKN